MLIVEIFNSSATQIKWGTRNKYGWQGSFDIDNDTISIQFVVHPDDDPSEAFLEFDINGSQQLSKKNKNHFIILSTISSGIDQYIKKEKPTKLHIQSDAEEPARVRVFSHLLKKIGKKFGYTFKQEPTSLGYDHITISK